MLHLQRPRTSIAASHQAPVCDELLFVLRSSKAQEHKAQEPFLPPPAAPGRCSARCTAGGQPMDQRMLFKFRSSLQKAAERSSSSSRVCAGAVAGQITNERKWLLTNQQLEMPAPLRARAILSARGTASDGEGFGIPAELIASPHAGGCPSLSALSSGCQGECGSQSAGRLPILFN